MSTALRNTTNGYKAQIAQFDRQIMNLTKRRVDTQAALDAITPALAKLPEPEPKKAATAAAKSQSAPAEPNK